MAKDLHDYCKRSNLRYYIIGGTFLGAIRHKGFIPWDDDMDIAMPREDFERFINEYPQEKYNIATYKDGPEYKYYLPKLVNKDYTIKEKTGNTTNLFIDIFPIDGMPDNYIKRKLHVFKIMYHRMKISFYYNDTIDMTKERKTYEKVLIKAAKTIPFKKIINPIREKDIIDRLLRSNSMKNSKLSGTIMGAYREREIVETRLFGEPTLYEFEDTELYGPERYDEYLSHMYGNYMTVPDKSKQVVHYAQILYKNEEVKG